MIVIVITGGIGSGKTAVTDYLISKGYKVIDTDLMAHEITSKNGKAISYIRDVFGEEYILKDGSMDREKIRKLVYKDENKKKLLEKGTTDIIISDTKKMIEDYRKKGLEILFVAIPLFFENGGENEKYFDKIWLVCSDIEKRVKRIKKRDNLNEYMIKKIMEKQMPDKDKEIKSDVVIKNSGTIEELHRKIDSLLFNLKENN